MAGRKKFTARRTPKKKFTEIRKIILESLKTGQRTVNKIASETGINWKTVDNHIIHLIGRGFVKEVFISPYVKIYEITERGKETANAKQGGRAR